MLGDGEPPVQRHQHGAQSRTGVEQHQIFRPVHAENCDAVAFADVELTLQRLRRLRYTSGEGRITQRRPLETDRRLFGGKSSVTLDQTTKIHRQSSVSPASYSASRPMRSRQSSAVHGSIREPQRLSR